MPCNVTQIGLNIDKCCFNYVFYECYAQAKKYNDHVYPKQMLNAWIPLMCVGGGLPFMQLTAQLIGLYLRRTAKIPSPEIKKVIEEQRRTVALYSQP